MTSPGTHFVGTFPASGIRGPVGLGEGIWSLDLDPATLLQRSDPRLLREFPAPSWLALHPALPVLYAASEQAIGAVAAFRIEADGSLAPLRSAATGGRYPCHLAVDPDGSSIVAVNYEDGVLTRFPLDADGDLSGIASTWRSPLPGSGAVASRQQAPHLHFAHFDRRTSRWLVSDLGRDRLVEIEHAHGAWNPVSELALPPGSGPRHLAQHRDGRIFVVGELDCSLHIVTRSPDGYRLEQSLPLLEEPLPAPGSLASHVAIEGDALFAAVRGPNLLVEFRITDDGVERVGATDCGGDFPRHFAVHPGDGEARAILVANTGSSTVTPVAAGARSPFRGAPRITIPAATAVVPARRSRSEPQPSTGAVDDAALGAPLAHAFQALNAGDLAGWLSAFGEEGVLVDGEEEFGGARLRDWTIAHATGVDARVGVTGIARPGSDRIVCRYQWVSRRYTGPSLVVIDHDRIAIRRFHILSPAEERRFETEHPDAVPSG